MKIAILHSRIRAEEKLLFEAFDKRGIAFDQLDDQEMIFDIANGEKASQYDHYDLVVERCINHGRALYSLHILNDRGVKTVNSAQVADVCGNKLQTTSALARYGIAQPRCLVAYTPESALAAI